MNSLPFPIRPAARARRAPAVALALAAVVALAGCATGSPARDERAVPPALPGGSLPDGSVRVDTEDARIAQLWSAAQDARSRDDDVEALERLYEALEIDPGNALLWSSAAEIQLDVPEPAQAENFAMKSNNFAGANPSLLYRNWLIIEHSRRLRGDLLGVRSAHRQVQQYQYR